MLSLAMIKDLVLQISSLNSGNSIVQGFSNFFGWRPKNLPEKSRYPQEILRLSKCTNTKLKVLIFALFAVFYAKNFFFLNLATLFEHLVTLKRDSTPSLRTAAIE
jgi:hypothetical protein